MIGDCSLIVLVSAFSVNNGGIGNSFVHWSAFVLDLNSINFCFSLNYFLQQRLSVFVDQLALCHFSCGCGCGFFYRGLASEVLVGAEIHWRCFVCFVILAVLCTFIVCEEVTLGIDFTKLFNVFGMTVDALHVFG